MAEVGIEENAIRLAVAGQATGTTAVDGATFDMQGFDGVMIICRIATANAGNFLKAQQGDTTSPTADLEGSKVVAAANNQLLVLDLNRLTKRYVRGVLIRAGTTTVSGDMIYIGYKAHNKPALNLITDVLLSKSLKSPAEGTP